MKPNSSHITFILDRSGSMKSIRTDVVGSITRFIKEQQETVGDCTFTLIQFDDQNPQEAIFDNKPIKEVDFKPDSYSPRGWTPLYDAVGLAIVKLGQQLQAKPETERPEKIIFVILTDGQENSSKEYTRERVFAMIQEQTKTYNWQFIYLGSNQDAFAVGQSFGVRGQSAITYSEQKTSAGFFSASAKVYLCRSTGDVNALSYSAKERIDLSN